ncbi:MAG: DNA replication and repair protein RecF [Verrucomicrobium sp.]|nr:DNA replication and repair protein RecF [Verrucomicrobium sp.]
MLRRLRLLRFRCHERLDWEPAPGRNELRGANGRGKTSILEAVHYLGRLRSFRTGQPRELAQFREGEPPGFAIEAEHEREGRVEKLAVRWENGTRCWSIDGDETVPLADFWGRLPAVLCSAEDGVLLRGPAARRQAWLDSLQSFAAPAHLPAVQRYNAVLRQRNAWLRQPGHPEVGAVLTAQILEAGERVVAGRRAAAETAARLAEPLLEAFFGGKGTCAFRYRPNKEAPSDQERRLGRSLAGPHRDEWEILWNGKPAGRFGSEGEQRLAALLLRLIEAHHLKICREAWPLFLIDDALTPLDPARRLTWEMLLPPEAQVIQAGTAAPGEAGLAGAAFWEVGPGRCAPARA